MFSSADCGLNRCIKFSGHYIIHTAQAGEGLFDNIISDANNESKKKEFAKNAIREAFAQYAKSVFIAEAGRPVSGQNSDDDRGNIRVTVPVALRVNQDAYAALCREIKKYIEDPNGLNLSPIPIVMKLGVSGDGKALYSHFANAVASKTTGHVFGVLKKIDPEKREAELDAYSIDGSICQGLSENAPFHPENIQVDILDEGNNVIGRDSIKPTTSYGSGCYFPGMRLHEVWTSHLVRKNEREGDSVLVLVAPDCFSRGHNRYQSDMETPITYPNIRELPATFTLPVETLRKAKTLRCIINYE